MQATTPNPKTHQTTTTCHQQPWLTGSRKTITCSHQQRRAVVRDAHSTPDNNLCARVQTTKPQRHSYALCTRPALQGHQVTMLQQKNPVQAARPCNPPLPGPSSLRPSPWSSSMPQAACRFEASRRPAAGLITGKRMEGKSTAASDSTEASMCTARNTTQTACVG